VVRPLLGVSRDEVLAYLAARGLAWLEDPSNADPRHTRNRVRRELLPYLETRFNPRVRETLARSGGLLADEAELLATLGDELYARLAHDEQGAVILDRAALAAAPRALARLALRRALAATGGLSGVSALHVDRLLDLAGSKAPAIRRLALPGRRQAVFRYREIHVCPRTPRAGADAYAERAQAISAPSLAGRAS